MSIKRLATLCVFLTAMLSSCSDENRSQSTQSEAQDAFSIQTSGNAPDSTYEPRIEIKAEMSGKIEKICVAQGQKVKRGELLVKLEDQVYDDQLRKATAVCKTADVNLTQLKSAVTYARANVEMQNHIVQFEESAKGELLSAQNQLRDSERQESAAETQANLDKANVAKLENEVRMTEIRAPIDGVVVKKLANVGDIATATTPVIELSGLSKTPVTATNIVR